MSILNGINPVKYFVACFFKLESRIEQWYLLCNWCLISCVLRLLSERCDADIAWWYYSETRRYSKRWNYSRFMCTGFYTIMIIWQEKHRNDLSCMNKFYAFKCILDINGSSRPACFIWLFQSFLWHFLKFYMLVPLNQTFNMFRWSYRVIFYRKL